MCHWHLSQPTFMMWMWTDVNCEHICIYYEHAINWQVCCWTAKIKSLLLAFLVMKNVNSSSCWFVYAELMSKWKVCEKSKHFGIRLKWHMTWNYSTFDIIHCLFVFFDFLYAHFFISTFFSVFAFFSQMRK